MPANARATLSPEERRVIVAASLGTAFEWYDFFLVGALAPELSRAFFSGAPPGAAFLFTLLSFAAGFAIRPAGALVFGRLGDLAGRKRSFLLTMVLMGAATFLVGLVPGQAAIGLAAPVLFVGLRMVQGLALGGEYGGAVSYVAEHAPPARRGAWTAAIQVTASAGLVLALGLILVLRLALGRTEFGAWGWRLPFLFSAALLAVSLWIRLRLEESPAFLRMQAEGCASRTPVREAFGRWRHLRQVLVAFFGLAMGESVIWYAGSFYSLFFLTQMLKVDDVSANLVIILGTLVTAPLYLLWGALSDRIGRKPVFLAGCVLGAAGLFPLFHALGSAANPALEAARARYPVVVEAAPADCAFQFNPVGTARFQSGCDIARAGLSRAGVNFSTRDAAPGTPARIHVGERVVEAYDGRAPDAARQAARFGRELAATLAQAGLNTPAAAVNLPLVVGVVVALMLAGTLCYGPMAAMFAELFPTRIRYTGMSLPYHVGVGWFGGFLPAIAFAIVAATGDIYAGLWYPVGLAATCTLVCLLLMPETRGVDLQQVE